MSKQNDPSLHSRARLNQIITTESSFLKFISKLTGYRYHRRYQHWARCLRAQVFAFCRTCVFALFVARNTKTRRSLLVSAVSLGKLPPAICQSTAKVRQLKFDGDRILIQLKPNPFEFNRISGIFNPGIPNGEHRAGERIEL